MQIYIFLSCLIFQLTYAEVLIPASSVSLKEFNSYIKTTEFMSYSEFQLNSLSDRSDQSDRLLSLSDRWLQEDISYLEINKDLRNLQEASPLKETERKLIFNILEKKIQQKNTAEQQKYYVSQLCWLFSNDEDIRSEFPQFQDYCQFKKVTTSELSKLFPEYKYLISDGNTIPLQQTRQVYYNEVPQNLILVSDKRETIHYQGNTGDLIKGSIKPGLPFVKGKCEQFESSEIPNVDSYQVYFNSSCVMAARPKSQFEKLTHYLGENKYEIISAGILIGAAVYYLRDKHIKVDNSSDFRAQVSFKF